VQRARQRSRSLDFAFRFADSLPRIRQQLHCHAKAFLGPSTHLHREGINLLLFPFVSSTSDDIDFPFTILEDWLVEPLLVSNSQLSLFLRLEECNRRSPVPPNCTGGHITYFRSWELTTYQFRKIIDDLDEAAVCVLDWHLALRRCKEGDIVAIRYVGTTQSPATPWKRATQKNERKGSLIGAFSACVRKYAPEVAVSRVFAIVWHICPLAFKSRTVWQRLPRARRLLRACIYQFLQTEDAIESPTRREDGSHRASATTTTTKTRNGLKKKNDG